MMNEESAHEDSDESEDSVLSDVEVSISIKTSNKGKKKARLENLCKKSGEKLKKEIEVRSINDMVVLGKQFSRKYSGQSQNVALSLVTLK